MASFVSPSLPHSLKPRPNRKTCPTAHQAQPTTNAPSPKSALANVLVIAANRGLGSFLADHLQGTPNLHTTHRPNSGPSPTQTDVSITHPLDALDRSATIDLIQSLRPDSIVSCLGGDVLQGYLPDYDANKNLIDAAEKAGVDNFVLISALGAGNSETSVPFQVMDTMRPILLEKSHAEAYLRASKLQNWTIVRPAPIVDGDPTGSAVATEGLNCYGTVTRPDLATVVAKLTASNAVSGKTLHVVDRKGLLITAPYVRPLEFWEPLPFEEFPL